MTSLLVDVDRATGTRLPPGWQRSPLGLIMPPRQRTRYDQPVGIDLFAGAGGFSMGFEQAGFHMAAASEMWSTAAITYMVNLARPGVKIHFDTPEREAEFTAQLEGMYRLDAKSRKKKPKGLINAAEDWEKLGPISTAGSGWISGQPAHVRGCEHFFVYDVRNLTGQIILDALGMEVGEPAVVVGGPPCQGYSLAGARNVMDPRNSLLFEFARLVCEIQPRTFVMENVTGLLSMTTPEGLPVIDAFCHAVEDGGYGEYDALRKALGGVDGAKAGLRKSQRVKRGKQTVDQDDDVDVLGEHEADEQLDLFGDPEGGK